MSPPLPVQSRRPNRPILLPFPPDRPSFRMPSQRVPQDRRDLRVILQPLRLNQPEGQPNLSRAELARPG